MHPLQCRLSTTSNCAAALTHHPPPARKPSAGPLHQQLLHPCTSSCCTPATCLLLGGSRVSPPQRQLLRSTALVNQDGCPATVAAGQHCHRPPDRLPPRCSAPQVVGNTRPAGSCSCALLSRCSRALPSRYAGALLSSCPRAAGPLARWLLSPCSSWWARTASW